MPLLVRRLDAPLLPLLKGVSESDQKRFCECPAIESDAEWLAFLCLPGLHGDARVAGCSAKAEAVGLRKDEGSDIMFAECPFQCEFGRQMPVPFERFQIGTLGQRPRCPVRLFQHVL